MFNIYAWTFIVLFALTFLLAIGFSSFKLYISKKYFSKKAIQTYEDEIQKYNFSINDSIDSIVSKMKKTIKRVPSKMEAYIEKSNPNTVYVSESLDLERQSFAIAHELGHSLRGFKSKAARNKKSLLSKYSPEEQICDYYAAAILLPLAYMRKKLHEKNFDDLSIERKKEFIKEIATEKHIMEDVVFRRIYEFKLIYGNN